MNIVRERTHDSFSAQDQRTIAWGLPPSRSDDDLADDGGCEPQVQPHRGLPTGLYGPAIGRMARDRVLAASRSFVFGGAACARGPRT